MSADGVKPDPRKTSAIREMPIPQTKRELQRFLGMVNFLAKFVPQLSTLTASLRELLQKDEVFTMAKGQIDAVNNLKKLVASDTVLKYYDTNLPLRLRTDASDQGLGAVLQQLHGDNWHPIAYASRSLNVAEKCYAPIEKET